MITAGLPAASPTRDTPASDDGGDPGEFQEATMPAILALAPHWRDYAALLALGLIGGLMLAPPVVAAML